MKSLQRRACLMPSFTWNIKQIKITEQNNKQNQKEKQSKKSKNLSKKFHSQREYEINYARSQFLGLA